LQSRSVYVMRRLNIGGSTSKAKTLGSIVTSTVRERQNNFYG